MCTQPCETFTVYISTIKVVVIVMIGVSLNNLHDCGISTIFGIVSLHKYKKMFHFQRSCTYSTYHSGTT